MAGVFAGAVAHDIGNTLSVANSAISWLEDPSMSTEERAAAVSDLKQASQELTQLTRRLLLLQGARTLAPVNNGPWAPVIKESIRFAQTSSPGAGLPIHLLPWMTLLVALSPLSPWGVSC